MASIERNKLVLCATDLTSASDEAVRRAHEWAAGSGSRLVVCHFVEEAIAYNILFPHENEMQVLDLVALEQKVAEAITARVGELTGRAEADFEVLVDNGPPAPGIVDNASRLSPHLLVLGGRVPAGRPPRVLGDTVDYVVRRSPVPLLVARPSPPSKTILFWSGSLESDLPAIEATARRARELGARFVVVRHLSEIEEAEAAPGAASGELGARLARAAAGGEVRTTGLEFEAAFGALSNELAIELVAAGASGQADLANGARRDDAAEVVRVSPCSVLVLPEDAPDPTGGARSS